MRTEHIQVELRRVLRGHWEFEISGSRGSYIATYSNALYRESATRRFEVSDAQMEKLNRQLKLSGVDGWYCHYCSPILDGIQWEVYAQERRHWGSNAFPEGFDALVSFLAEEFGCRELVVEGGYESSFPDEMRGIDHVLAYADMLVDVEELHWKYRSGLLGDRGLERGEADATLFADELLHDLYVLVREEPSYANYRAILERNGVFDYRKTAEQSMEDADDDLVIASMLAISVADRFYGNSDDFRKYAKDGTFKRWLSR